MIVFAVHEHYRCYCTCPHTIDGLKGKQPVTGSPAGLNPEFIADGLRNFASALEIANSPDAKRYLMSPFWGKVEG